jgi:hypothetical protein
MSLTTHEVGAPCDGACSLSRLAGPFGRASRLCVGRQSPDVNVRAGVRSADYIALFVLGPKLNGPAV